MLFLDFHGGCILLDDFSCKNGKCRVFTYFNPNDCHDIHLLCSRLHCRRSMSLSNFRKVSIHVMYDNWNTVLERGGHHTAHLCMHIRYN